MARSIPIPLKINCGYARTAIRELTTTSKAKHRGVIHRANRAKDFCQLFDRPTYANLFESHKTKQALFDKNCDFICNSFSKKWRPPAKRVEYTSVFSIENWKALSDTEKNEHTLSKCKACFTEYEHLQKAFPGKPMHTPPTPIITLPDKPAQEKELGRKVLEELNTKWEEKFEHPITTVLPKIMPEANLTKKEPKSQQKKKNRKQKRKFVNEVNEQLAKNATMTTLAEAESLSSYQRKRLAYSFDSPTPSKRQKPHSPNEENMDWDVSKAMATLQTFPENETINWSSMARTFNIPNKNGGQILKETAQKHGIDTLKLDKKSQTPRLRRSKTKLQGQEFSMPCLPTKDAVVQEKNHLIASGELSIGEPCSPYTLKKSVINSDGNLQIKSAELCGRKIPLIELRGTLLRKHQEFMRLTRQTDIMKMTMEEILTFMKLINHEVDPTETLQQLQSKVQEFQHTRTLAIWHDHSTILSTGYILFAVWVIYDTAVFLTEAEYKNKTGKQIPSVQSIIEQPEIYMIAPSSSSPSDQLALVNDRIECLQDLSISITADNGVDLKDKLRFFCGDKPAQQFERGTQIGGTYKCGGCGCKDTMMSDLPHALRREWRSLTALQTLVLAGKYGKTPGVLKPFDSLKVSELREELKTRDMKDTEAKLKPELQEELTTTLLGAQRVPTLLTLNPTQSLSELNLAHYEVVDCEPLHDIKGHLYNLLFEIPHLLSQKLKTEYTQVLEASIPKQKANGAVLRTTAIKLFMKLLNSTADTSVVTLLDTIVRISNLLYMPESRRSPKMVLRLYNCTWLHHELCKNLFPTLKTQTLSHFFGIYLHAIVVHAPTQYEMMSLSSVNAESQERLFSQAKRISLRATNRKTENVLPTILVSIQARQKMGTHKSSIAEQESIVRSASSKQPKYRGTEVEKSFISARLSSWQAHLERVSTFLKLGQGEWWEEKNECYVFYDADADPDFHQAGPGLLHFRDSNLPKIGRKAKDAWNDIIKDKTPLPTPSIKIYDVYGNYEGTRTFKPTEHQQMEDHTTALQELTEEEFENLDIAHTNTTPLNSQSATAHHQTLEAKQLFSNNCHKSVDVAMSQVPDERIANLTVQPCDSASEELNESTSTEAEESMYKLQTKAAKLIEKITGHTKLLSEFDFLRATLKLKKAQNKKPSEEQKEEYAELLDKVHHTVFTAKHTAKQSVKEFEQGYYKLNSTFPDKDTQDYKQLRKRMDLAKYICSTWSTFI